MAIRPDRHKQDPIPFRPPADLRAWLLDYAATEQRSVSAVIIEALAAYRKTTENVAGNGGTGEQES